MQQLGTSFADVMFMCDSGFRSSQDASMEWMISIVWSLIIVLVFVMVLLASASA